MRDCFGDDPGVTPVDAAAGRELYPASPEIGDFRVRWASG
jgi:hypothetical protein